MCGQQQDSCPKAAVFTFARSFGYQMLWHGELPEELISVFHWHHPLFCWCCQGQYTSALVNWKDQGPRLSLKEPLGYEQRSQGRLDAFRDSVSSFPAINVLSLHSSFPACPSASWNLSGSFHLSFTLPTPFNSVPGLQPQISTLFPRKGEKSLFCLHVGESKTQFCLTVLKEALYWLWN